MKLKIVLTFIVFLIATVPVWGQASQVSQISGTVQDATGAAIPGAEIKAENIDTGVVRTVTSGADGNYIISALAVGPYKLQVAKAGFSTYVQTGIILQVNSNPSIPVSLKIGQVTEQVEVQANAAQVETHSTGVGQVIDNARVLELPLNGRQITSLVTLSGGANDFVPVSAGQSLVSNKNYPTSTAFSVAGGQGGSTLFLLDGGVNMDPISNIGLPMPFPDALQEFKVETSSLPANYGSQPGGVINVVTKGGTNEFHGDAFWFIRNTAVNARNFFATGGDGLKRNQLGGVIGGPVVKNKLFFFAGYQATLERVTPSSTFTYVPTAQALAGDFTAMMSTPCVSSNVTLKAPFVNNKIDPALFNKVALAYLKYVPVSTDPCGKVYFSIPTKSNENQGVTRIDWTVNDKHTLFVRYFVTDYERPSSFSPTNLLLMSTDNSVGLSNRVQTGVIGHTFIISPTTISSLRTGFSRGNVLRYNPDGMPTPTSLGSKVYQGVPGFIQMGPGGGYFSPVCTNCSPGPWVSNSLQGSWDLSLVRGAHQVSVGVLSLKNILTAYGNFQKNGNFSFNGAATGNVLTDLMMGAPSSMLQSMGQLAAERVWTPSMYAQDNVRVSSRITLNLGIRWDPFLAPHKRLPGMVSIYDPAWFAAVVRSKKFTNAPVGVLWDGEDQMPGNGAYFFNRVKEFAPRFGIVFDPRGKGLETIRAGMGIFYGTTPLFLSVATHTPYASPVTLSFASTALNALSDPWAGQPTANPFPVTNVSPTVGFSVFGGGLGTFAAHPKPTYMQQWNLAFQKQLPQDWLFSATYLGNKTVHLMMADPNNYATYVPGNCVAGQYGLTAAGPCSTTGNANYRRLMILANPTEGRYYAGLSNLDNTANATYNGLLVSMQHRFAHGFSILANHTWSHCLTENEVQLNGGGTGQNPLDRHAEYGNCLSDRRHAFNFTGVVKSPTFEAAWMKAILGNWQESTIFTAATGSFLTPSVGVDNSRTGQGDRPNVVGNPNAATRTLSAWFDKTAFVSNTVGTFGNAGRGIILGPGSWNVDIALSRTFQVKEGQRVDFRAEAFNLFNHARFGNPGTAMNSPTSYGVITTARDPRILQGALKFVF